MGSAAYIEQVIPRPTVYIANLLFFLVVCCQSHLGGGWSEPLESFEGVCGKLLSLCLMSPCKNQNTKEGKGQDKQVS